MTTSSTTNVPSIINHGIIFHHGITFHNDITFKLIIMKRILFLICLFSIGIIASAQTKTNSQRPPVRTTDPSPATAIIKPVIPIRTGGGNAIAGGGSDATGKIAPAPLPLRTTDPGGAAKNPAGTPKTQQNRAATLSTTAPKNSTAPQLPSSLPVKQSTTPVPATPQVH